VFTLRISFAPREELGWKSQQMNTYMVQSATGDSQEIEAELYQGDGADIVFMNDGHEVLRTEATKVLSIPKAR
jgi:hypothetical protein